MNSTLERTEEAAVAGAAPCSAVKRSRIYLAAWVAAEKALPKESLRLIEAHDELHGKWREAGWPSPIPPDLVAAGKAIEADPLASIAFDLRQKTNQASADEYRADNPPNAELSEPGGPAASPETTTRIPAFSSSAGFDITEL